MQLALPVPKTGTPTTPPMTCWSGLPSLPPKVPVPTAPPPPRVPTASLPPRTPYAQVPLRMKIPIIPPCPTQLDRSPQILTVMPPSNQTCNLVIAASGQSDPQHADILPYHFENTVMNPTTGTEARICNLLARRVDGQDVPPDAKQPAENSDDSCKVGKTSKEPTHCLSSIDSTYPPTKLLPISTW